MSIRPILWATLALILHACGGGGGDREGLADAAAGRAEAVALRVGRVLVPDGFRGEHAA